IKQTTGSHGRFPSIWRFPWGKNLRQPPRLSMLAARADFDQTGGHIRRCPQSGGHGRTTNNVARPRQESSLEHRILDPLALGELWQRLSGDERLEVRGLLMRRESGFILENLVEEKLRGFGA